MLEFYSSSSFNFQGKTIIQAFSGSGLVGVISAKFIANQLGMDELGYIDHESIPPIAIVEEGVSKQPFRVYGNDNYAIVINQATIHPSKLKAFIRDLYNWYLDHGAHRVVILGGLPTGRPTDASTVKYGIVTSTPKLEEEVSMKGFNTIPEGVVYGSIALSLLEGGNNGVDTMALLANCIASVPDFLAAKKIINVFAELEEFLVTTEYLDFRAEELRERLIEEGYDEEDEYFDDEDDEDDFLSDPSKFI